MGKLLSNDLEKTLISFGRPVEELLDGSDIALFDPALHQPLRLGQHRLNDIAMEWVGCRTLILKFTE